MSRADKYGVEEYGLFADLANLSYEEESDHKCQKKKWLNEML